MKQFLRFHSACSLVAGATRAIIFDMQRREIEFIPLEMYQVCQKLEDYDIEALKNLKGEENYEAVAGYIDFLLAKEICFICTEEERQWFSGLSYKYETPFDINNAIVDSNKNSCHDWKKLIAQLSYLRCPDVQLRFYDIVSVSLLREVISYADKSAIKNIEVILPFESEPVFDTLFSLLENEKRICRIVVHSSPVNDHKAASTRKNIIQVSEKINSASHCGIIDPSLFVVNRSTFLESHQFNTCLNKKISIDINGDIKNCPSSSKVFGNIGEMELFEAINAIGFKNAWTINKDQISVCKDCEFRHICTDCRAYLQYPNDIYSKPLKCGYNPYTGEWQKWSTNPLSKMAIDYYNIHPIAN